MASTNKTTNYELSQYVGTDKPTYLGDYNGDMLKIDTAIHGVATSVGTETGRINILENNVGTIGNLQTTDKTSVVNAINEVNTNSNNNATNIGTLSNLETSNKTTIVNAINEVVDKFKFTDVDTCNCAISGGQLENPSITCAKNSDGSIFKIYGSITAYNLPSGEKTITISNTGLPSVDTEYTINAGSVAYISEGSIRIRDIVYKTNGNIEIKFNPGNSGVWRFYLPPCIYINVNFGDTPTPNA